MNIKLNQLIKIAIIFMQPVVNGLTPTRVDVREVKVDKLLKVGTEQFYRIRFQPSLKNPQGFTQLVNADFLKHYSTLAKSI